MRYVSLLAKMHFCTKSRAVVKQAARGYICGLAQTKNHFGYDKDGLWGFAFEAMVVIIVCFQHNAVAHIKQCTFIVYFQRFFSRYDDDKP